MDTITKLGIRELIEAGLKTARSLATAPFDAEDDFLVNIHQAAVLLTSLGLDGSTYRTQWSSGTTLWITVTGRVITVGVEGVVS